MFFQVEFLQLRVMKSSSNSIIRQNLYSKTVCNKLAILFSFLLFIQYSTYRRAITIAVRMGPFSSTSASTFRWTPSANPTKSWAPSSSTIWWALAPLSSGGSGKKWQPSIPSTRHINLHYLLISI